MRIGLLSDIHGDPAGLQRALDLLEAQGVASLLCAGDVVGYGPDPEGAVGLLARHQVTTIRGNHDRWALERGCDRDDPHGGARVTPWVLAWLKGLPPIRLLVRAGRLLTLAHGTPRSDMEFLSKERFGPEAITGLLEEYDTDILVVGHTHVPMWYRCDRGLVVNPGSVVAPQWVDSSRSVAVLDAQHRQVEFFCLDSGERLEVPRWWSEEEDR